MNHFADFAGLAPALLQSLERIKFTTPTPIQAQAIPRVLAGCDILGSAQTGTGKTGAFAIPLVSKLLNNQVHSALILTPTRELAVQVLDAVQQILGHKTNINTALLIGGQDIRRQIFQLRKNPRIIVGTPGRINDHLEQKTVRFDKTDYLVLDETDRMLDMGFGHQIDRIIAHLSTTRQTLMFSATMPKNIAQMAAKYLKNPERIQIGSCLQPIEAIQQESIKLGQAQKYDQLVKELGKSQGSVVVFVRTKHNAQKIANRLFADDLEAQAIHGDLRQNRRDRVISEFREQKFRILVATDVAARGLDVPHISLVINHDLPQCPEDYIHRIGRTARAGASGSAVNFISNDEQKLWHAIERFMKTGQPGSHQNNDRPSEFGSRPPKRFGGGNDRRKRSGGGGFFKRRGDNRGGFKKARRD
jgi:ATP-dependent RNA helicase DeaD